MDFKVTATDEDGLVYEQVFEQFHDALSFIKEAMSQWNNFYPNERLTITLDKIVGQTPTLGISVDDEMNILDRFGG